MLNGYTGAVKEWNDDRDRWVVEASGKSILVKAGNIFAKDGHVTLGRLTVQQWLRWLSDGDVRRGQYSRWWQQESVSILVTLAEGHCCGMADKHCSGGGRRRWPTVFFYFYGRHGLAHRWLSDLRTGSDRADI